MATNDFHVSVSDNSASASLKVSDAKSLRSVNYESGSPYYVGARAYVTQTENGAVITIIDKDGTTTATILNGQNGSDGRNGIDGIDGANGVGITSIEQNEDGTLTITLDDGSSYDTEPLKGADGQDGYTPIKGVDYFDGEDGRDGVDGSDGEDGVGIVSITKTGTVGLVDTYTITFTDGTTTTFEVTNGANGSGSVADVWVDGTSVLDGDTAKIDLTGKADVSDIPTKTSDLTNDSGFITGYTETDPVFMASVAHGITAANIATWNNKSDFSGNYNDLPNKPTIPTVPTNVSAFTNDAGYLTSFTETDPTVPSWAKASTKPSYTASEIIDIGNYVLKATPYFDLDTTATTGTDKEIYDALVSLGWDSDVIV